MNEFCEIRGVAQLTFCDMSDVKRQHQHAFKSQQLLFTTVRLLFYPLELQNHFFPQLTRNKACNNQNGVYFVFCSGDETDHTVDESELNEDYR